MIRAIPILIIVGLALYSFFEVLQTPSRRIRRSSRAFWLAAVLVPVIGAALWFLVGRPKRGNAGPPRVISLRGPGRPVAPDDDPAFLRRLEDEAWRRKREQQRRRQQPGQPGSGASPEGGTEQQEPPAAKGGDDTTPPRRPNEGPAPGGPGVAPAS